MEGTVAAKSTVVSSPMVTGGLLASWLNHFSYIVR